MSSKTLRLIRHRIKKFISVRPWLYFPIFRFRSRYGQLLVREGIDICIEGYPRSANSFATGAFEKSQPRSVSISHHTHTAANAIRACQLDVPTIVLIRNPEDAIISNTALVREVEIVQNRKSTNNLIDFSDRIETWITFYSALKPYKEKFVIAPFKHVIQDMGAVITEVNAKFGTDFVPFEHTDENTAAVHASRGYHAGPNDRRASLKKDTRNDFEAVLKTDEVLKAQLHQANKIYESYLSDSDLAE